LLLDQDAVQRHQAPTVGNNFIGTGSDSRPLGNLMNTNN
jgi:hypothetical protein